MGAIRAGGLASGLDTNNIIEKLVETAKQPIYDLQNKNYVFNLEKSVFRDVGNDLASLRTAAFNLKMQTTFTSKSATVADKSILNARATAEASKGSHIVDVIQLAKNSIASSKFLSFNVFQGGAGITGGLLQGSTSPLNQLEGTTAVRISELTSTPGDYIAESIFEPNGGGVYNKQTAGNTISIADKYGVISSPRPDETLSFKLNVPGGSPIDLKDIKVDFTNASIKDVNHLTALIEENLNVQINNALGKNFDQFVAVRADYDATAGTWTMGVYNVSNYDFGVECTGGSGTLQADLGLDVPMTPSRKGAIMKYVVGDNMNDLETKIKDSKTSIIYGTGFAVQASGLKEGVFLFYQDSSANTKLAGKTQILSSPITLNAPPAGHTSTSYRPLSNSGILPASDPDALDGTFTINGTTITLKDAKNKSIDEVMAIVNGSGAGVKMTYDGVGFVLEHNTEGAMTIRIGAANDTSKFFDIFKLSPATNARTITGSTKGSLNTTVPMDTVACGLNFAPVKGIFSINDTPIYVDPEVDTVDDIIKKVNASGADVKLSYDSVRDKFIITSNTTKQIKLGSPSDTSNLLNVFGLHFDPQDPWYAGEAGTQAIVKVNGDMYYRNSNTIDDVITGVEFTIAKEGTTTIDIDVDSDKAVNALADFIKQYNTLIEKLTVEEISKKDRKDKMAALTEEKKKGMSEEEIKNYMKDYDKLHKIDIISKSSELRTLKKHLRSMVSAPLNQNISAFKELTEIGLEIAGKGNIAETKKGYLVVISTDLDTIKQELKDNSKLMKNISEKSEELFNFFGKYNEDRYKYDETKVKQLQNEKERLEKDPSQAAKQRLQDVNKEIKAYTEGGYINLVQSWARQFESAVINYNDPDGSIGSRTKAEGVIDQKINRNNREIERKTDAAESYLERLWREFAAMEKRVAEINSQGQYLAKIGGGGGQQAAQ